jgi:high affinity Mn2+ porin
MRERRELRSLEVAAALSWLLLGGSGVAARAQPGTGPTSVTAHDTAAAAVPAPTAPAREPSGSEAPASVEERLSIHGQATFIEQYHPPFRSPYSGPLSLDPGRRADETLSVSLFIGGHLWRGAELYVNPEALQGFGLSNSTGIAGFPNGEAFKVGTKGPIGKLSRVFLRQTFALGHATEAVPANQNRLAGQRPVDSITLTVGKYSVVDLFDDNSYAHDSRAGFLNWTINELGAFDMASPAFNYTYGATVEWIQAWRTVRAGFFLEPTYPNSQDIDTTFRQFQPVVELEERHAPWGQPGKLKVLLFGKHVGAGSFSRAVASAQATGQTASTAGVRNGPVWGYGGGLNLEQRLATNLGIFARASVQSGQYEEFSFTQVEKSVSAGLVLTGPKWGRDNDALGLGVVANGIFAAEQAYLAAGGTGIIIGDGALNYGGEAIVEAYYKLVPWHWAALTLDFQLVNHPAYNRDRGPVSVFGARVHLEL